MKGTLAIAFASVALIACQPESSADGSGGTYFTGFTLIDGTSRGALASAAMVVRDGRVIAAGTAAEVPQPAGAEEISLAGKYVIPGLINTHGHVSDSARDLRTYAAYGVTTVVSLGGEPPDVFAARAVQDSSDSLQRARVFVAGPVLTPTTPEEARTQVIAAEAQGVDIVKIRVDDNLGTARKMSPEVYQEVIAEAQSRGLRVAAHVYYLADAVDLLTHGVDFIAHSIRDTAVGPEIIKLLTDANVCVSPTLMREVSTFVYETTPAFFDDSLFLAHADAAQIAANRDPKRQESIRNSTSAQRYKAGLVVAKQNLKALSDAGVTIAMGTDTGPAGRFQGYFELMELEHMADAGLSPAQILAAATIDAARCMKLDADLGTLSAGKYADFVVLDANPLDNISNVRRIASVWIAGRRLAP